MFTLRDRMSLRAAGTLAVLLLVATTLGVSQSKLEDNLKQMGAATVTGYIQPVTDLFGADMHSGYFHAADIETFGFHLRLDIIAMAAAVSDGQKTYDAPTPWASPATFKAPTVFGGPATSVTNPSTGFSYHATVDGLFNTSYMPLAVPQLTIGNIFGTQATVRYITIPKMNGDQIPNITLWGLGVRHSVSQYLPMVPLDLSAGIYFNSFTFGELIDFKGMAINAQASKSFSILTVYGGLQWENSSMNLSYTSTDITSPVVSISMDGANSFRFLAGIDLGLGPIHLFADANFGSITAFSGGIGFGN